MTKTRLRISASLLIFVCLAVGAVAQVGPADFPSARTAALGGPHFALADDLTVLFTNPAGYRAAGPELSVAELSTNLAGPIFDIASVILEAGSSDLATILASPNVQTLLQGLNAAFTLGGPVSFAYVGGGLGFGFFNSTDIGFESVGVVPNLTATMREDITFLGGYALRIPFDETSPHALDVGVALKAFVGGEVSVSRSVLDLIADPNIDASMLLAEPFVLEVGVGVDLGVRWAIGEVLSFGLVGRDLYTPVRRNTYTTTADFLAGGTPTPSNALLPIDLSGGVMWSPPLGPLGLYFTDWKLLLSYDDILDFLTHPSTARNPILHIGVGTELVLLEILALRGGFRDGLFAAGLGLDLSFFKLNLSMYGTELSSQPGLQPQYNVLLGVEFRF